jgi:hypothetical protein
LLTSSKNLNFGAKNQMQRSEIFGILHQALGKKEQEVFEMKLEV